MLGREPTIEEIVREAELTQEEIYRKLRDQMQYTFGIPFRP